MITVKSLSTIRLDYYDDEGFWKLPLVQKLVKEGQLYPREKLASFSDTNFAAIVYGNRKIKRVLPMYNKTAALLSANWIEEHAQELPPELIKEAQEKLNNFFKEIEPTVDLRFKSYTEYTPEDVKSVLDIKTANLVTSLQHMNWIDRVVNCTKFVKVASLGDVTVDNIDVLSYVAKPKIGNIDVFESSMRKRDNRVKLADNGVISEVWSSLLDFISKTASEPAKLVEAIAIFDKTAGFDKEYDNGIEDPARTVWGVKIADKVYLGEDDDYEIKKRNILEWAQTLTPSDFGASFCVKGLSPKDMYNFFIQDPLKAYDSFSPAIKRKVDKQVKAMLAKRKETSY